MTTYRIIIQRVISYTVDVEAPDLKTALANADTALDDEEGGPEAWPYDITSEQILTANAI